MDSKKPTEHRTDLVPQRTRTSLKTWALGLDKPSLTDRPQRFGVLPTIRFWNRVDTIKHQFPALAAGTVLGLSVMWFLLPLMTGLFGPWVALLTLLPIAMLATAFPLGLFERWLRREIERRRQGDGRGGEPRR